GEDLADDEYGGVFGGDVAAEHRVAVDGGCRRAAADGQLGAFQAGQCARRDDAGGVVALADHVVGQDLGQLAVRRGDVRGGGQLLGNARVLSFQRGEGRVSWGEHGDRRGTVEGVDQVRARETIISVRSGVSCAGWSWQ